MEQKFRKATCWNCHKEFTFNQKEWGKISNPHYCPQCVEIVKKEEIEEKRKQNEEHIKYLIAKLPRLYQNITTNKDYKRYIEKSLYITGDVGTGKTVLVVTLAKHYIINNIPIKWISYPEFIMMLQNAFKNDAYKNAGTSWTTKINPYNEAEEVAEFEGYLFIDDLGAEKLTDFVRQITYFIINHREQNMLKTVITSNFSLQEVDAQIDRRISSRIAGICEVLKLKGQDKRLKV